MLYRVGIMRCVYRAGIKRSGNLFYSGVGIRKSILQESRDLEIPPTEKSGLGNLFYKRSKSGLGNPSYRSKSGFGNPSYRGVKGVSKSK